MWGIVPAAGAGSRIQPLAFSKELLPVGSRLEGDAERPRAVSEYLVERMIAAGAEKVCFVIAPGKSKVRTRASRLSESSSGTSAKAVAPIGTLTKKIHDQLSRSVRIPPRMTPAAAPICRPIRATAARAPAPSFGG